MARDVIARRRATAARLAIEPLEGRMLLSGAGQTSQKVSYGNATYKVLVSGPGSVSVGTLGNGQYAITLSGTTVGSTVAVEQVATTSKFAGAALPVGRVTVSSGSLGQFDGLGTVNLLGSFGVAGTISSIQVGSIGKAAKVKVPGGLGSLVASGSIALGPAGLIALGSVSGNLQAGSVSLQGGSIRVAGNVGGLAIGSFSATQNGSLDVDQDAGPVSISGTTYLASGGSFNVGLDAQSLDFGNSLTIDPGGRLAVGRDILTTLSTSGNVALDAGQFYVGRDVIGATSINGSVSAANGGNLTVGRDLVGSLSINGNLDLVAGGQVVVGRNVGVQGQFNADGTVMVAPIGATISGSVVVASGGLIAVVGNLNELLVGGTMTGQGTDAVDLSVGLDFNNWTVDGGQAGVGGVSNLNVDVAKNIDRMSILHGLFNDDITAGVLITSATIGPDGPTAAFDTEIRAGVQITNFTFNGTVESDRPANPAGRRTRIIAGEDRSGDWIVGGNINNLIITGSLINAVVAADVQPFGGDGSKTLTPAAPPAAGALDYYDAPDGNQYVARFGANAGLPFAAPPFDTAIDPTVHDNVLPGSLNKSFYVPPTPAVVTNGVVVTPEIVNAPSSSTVLGGVFTTAHANDSDYAGLFASDTTGVYAGSLPS